MAKKMKIRAKSEGDRINVRVLMRHKMESGQRTKKDGSIIPAWYIKTVTAKLNGKEVFEADWGPSISQNPFFQFFLKGGKIGDEVAITWTDNKGESRTDKAIVN